MIRKIYALAISVLALGMSPAPAHADALSAGIKAVAKGDIVKAVKKFNKSKKPEAIFQLALLAEAGMLKDCDRVYCAAQWFNRAGNAGYIPGFTHLAILNLNNGFKEIGITQFQWAARWNEPLARDLLGQMKENVPEPDLYEQAIRQQRQQQLAIQERQLQAQGQMAHMLGYLIGCGFDSACIAQQQAAATSTYPHPAQRPVQNYSDNGQNSYSGSDVQMCPDGSYVAGGCRMAPDGSYVGGQPQMAPNGSYVTGNPQMAPDGSYVGGNGPVIMCPDGSYVSGTRCHLTPNGTYVGK
ncbi:hypothetical protein [Parasphingorhabdus sp.]|uniref:hypothetical protein n=1 Tax=Parasphingorhabdus sp. TaxID=2709688 RepID=UPI002F93B8E7